MILFLRSFHVPAFQSGASRALVFQASSFLPSLQSPGFLLIAQLLPFSRLIQRHPSNRGHAVSCARRDCGVYLGLDDPPVDCHCADPAFAGFAAALFAANPGRRTSCSVSFCFPVVLNAAVSSLQADAVHLHVCVPVVRHDVCYRRFDECVFAADPRLPSRLNW